jgi:hypothetical protein
MVDKLGNELQKQAPAEHDNHLNSSTLTFADHCLHCHSKDQITLLCSPMTTIDSLQFIFLKKNLKIWKFSKNSKTWLKTKQDKESKS